MWEAATAGQSEKGDISIFYFISVFWNKVLLFACSSDVPPSIHQVGHCGTLDPMATGLLIVCVGKATKVVDW